MATHIEKAVVTAVETGVKNAAKLPSTDTTITDAPQVASKVLTELGPVIVNATNAEPWYQSRVTWGVIIAAVATIVKPFIGELPLDEQQTADIVAALATAGQAVGFALTLYGRWKAKKPIGA